VLATREPRNEKSNFHPFQKKRYVGLRVQKFSGKKKTALKRGKKLGDAVKAEKEGSFTQRHIKNPTRELKV